MKDRRQVIFHTVSKTGNRSRNEDACMAMEKNGVFYFAAADGLGGMESGEIASRAACEAVADLCQQSITDIRMEEMIQQANQAVLREQANHGCLYGMKTTLVLLKIDQKAGTVQWAHVGDSRLYLLRGLNCSRKTEDHSVPGMLQRSGEIREKEIRFHKDRSKLVRVLGSETESALADISNTMKLKQKTAFLLCTDGFWEWVDEKQMRVCYRKAGTPEEWLQLMEEKLWEQAGGMEVDNYTAVAVWIRW